MPVDDDLCRGAGVTTPRRCLPRPVRDWLPRSLGRDYDPRSLPVAAKTSALIGMGMTERQGGSDVRANLTRAERIGDGSYRLTGHKWFFSAPMCDAHLVLAQAGARTVLLFFCRACCRTGRATRCASSD